MSFSYSHQPEHDVIVQLSHFFLHTRIHKICGNTIVKSLIYIITMIRDNTNNTVEILKSCGIIIRSDDKISISPLKLRRVFYLRGFSKFIIYSGWRKSERKSNWFTYEIPNADPIRKTLKESPHLYVEEDEDTTTNKCASSIADFLVMNFTRDDDSKTDL